VLVEIPKVDIRDELKALRAIIGGYIETVHIAADAVLLVDEDGYVKCLPPNPAATVFARQMILGTALLCGLAVNADGEMYFSDRPERYYKESA
jgi:hypothetical protein